MPLTSPFLHRDTNFYLMTSLAPETEYEVDLYLIPNAKAAREGELVSSREVAFSTRPKPIDPFSLINLSAWTDTVGSDFITLSWASSGVSGPKHHLVSLYRVLYSEHHVNEVEAAESVYVEAKQGLPDGARLEGLRSATRYQVWVEAYLRNGKIAKSNVLDITTAEGSNLVEGIDTGKCCVYANSVKA